MTPRISHDDRDQGLDGRVELEVEAEVRDVVHRALRERREEAAARGVDEARDNKAARGRREGGASSVHAAHEKEAGQGE